jgi:hypothetical protein
MQCLNPDCGIPAVGRGLCKPCYMLARKLVRRGDITWEELERHKRCLAPSEKGKPAPMSESRRRWLLQ